MTKTEAVTYFGNPYRVWRAMKDAGHKISLQAVYQWKERLPDDRVEQLTKILHGSENGNNTN